METAKGWQFATPFLRQLVPHALWREGAGFSVGRYAFKVYNELLWALDGLVEK